MPDLRTRIVLAVRHSRSETYYYVLPPLWVPWQGGLHRWGKGA